MISIIDKYRLLAVRGGDGGGGGGGNSDQEAADMAAAVAQGRGSTVTSARPSGSSGRSDTTTYGGGGGGRDSSDNAAAANAARIAAERATYEQQQAQAAAAQKAAADNAARIAAERATYEQQQRAAQAASDNAARIAAERASYQMPSAPSAPSSGTSLSDVVNELFGIPSAEAKPVTTAQEFADAQRAIAAAKQMGVTGGVPIGYKSPADIAKEADLAEAQAQAAINAAAFRAGFPTGLAGLAASTNLPAQFTQPAGQTTTFNKDQSGIVPAGVWTDQQMSMPDVRQSAEAARIAAAQPADTFFTDLQRVNNKLAAIRGMDTANLVGSGRGVAGPTAEDIQAARAAEAKASPFEAYSQVKSVPTSPFESVVKAALSSAPTENVYNYTPTFTPAPVSKVNMSDYVQTGDKQMLPSVGQQSFPRGPAPVISEPEPVISAPATTVPVTTTPTTIAPTQKGVIEQIMSDMDAANAKRIAELEQANKFAGGNKAQVAAALGVDPSELKSRIVFQDGQQKVDYYTKGLDQVLGEMISGPFNAIGSLFGGGNYDLKNGYSVTPSGDVITTPTFSSKGYGPYGDLTAEEYRQQYGGRDVTQPVTPTPVPVTPPVPPTPVPPAPPSAKSAWSRTRSGLPYDPYNYGYGGEYTYYSAEGGPVSPLNKIRK